MGTGRGGDLRGQEDLGYLSDESDFYGDEATKQALEGRVYSFDVEKWWKQKSPSLLEVADSNVEAETEKKSAVLFNSYEGLPFARQLNETVEELLQRLPPATTRISESIQWIYVWNPYKKRLGYRDNEDSQMTLDEDGQPKDEEDRARCQILGENLLEELSHIKSEIERHKAGNARFAVTQAFNVEKETIVRKILDTATKTHCTSGKWMIFCQPDEVNAVWTVVARATVDNELGEAAKVSPDSGQAREARVICIYTHDFNDIDDVSRVIHKLRGLGLVETRGKPIYYKCDVYTYLGLQKGNEYGIRPWLYSSTDMLKPKDQRRKDRKIEGFFYKKKKDEGDWESLEFE